MSYQTDLCTTVTFNRENFNNKSTVEDALQEAHKALEAARAELRTLAYMTEPSKFYNKEEYDSVEQYLEEKITTVQKLFEEFSVKKYKLQLLLDVWDSCHNKEGKAISLKGKELSKEDTKKLWLGDISFLDGDYIQTDVKDGNEI